MQLQYVSILLDAVFLNVYFQVFDTENRNYLESDDIKAIVTGFEDGFDDTETIEVLRDADVCGDGRIIYEDFIESIFSNCPELYEEKVKDCFF